MNVPVALPDGARADAATAAGPTLREIPPGGRAVVRAVRATSDLRRRLLEMGFVSGTELRVVRLAPLADPMEVELHGYHLSLRRAEADTVLVERI